VAFGLEFEYSCTSLLNRVQIKLSASSDNTELDETLHDNIVHLSAHIRYQPELFIHSESSLNRYEVQPVLLSTQEPGPEFITKFKVQYVDCYPIHNVSVHIHTPAMGYGGLYFMSVSRILSPDDVICMVSNMSRARTAMVPFHPEDLGHTAVLNCSNSWCQTITCRIPVLQRNSDLSILRIIHNHFFTNVSAIVCRIHHYVSGGRGAMLCRMYHYVSG
ncbi:hypothetical protein GDO81_022715, partial [Engystomops pustulosus]